jgi:hypothetical protein
MPERKQKPLPKVTVKFARAGKMEDLTPAEMKSIFCNPIYAGLGPYPSLITDEVWVNAAARMIEEDGPEQFLVNLLYVLRKSFNE